MMTSNKVLTNKDIVKMSLNEGSLGMEFSWNYERQMNVAFCMMMEPALKKIYHDDPEGYKEALERHLEFFNITPQFAPFVGGVVASMEEAAKAGEVDVSAISSIKASLMGPLSGIGDSIFIGAIRIIAVSVGLSFALQGNLLGPILYFLIYNIPAFLLRIRGAQKGYNLGFSYLTQLQKTGAMDKLMSAAGILAMLLIGGMASGMVYTEFAIKLGQGESAKSLQEILNSIMPGIVGLSVTWLYYWMLKKKVSVILMIIVTVLFGIAGAYFGVFA
ncbi:MULTISPECIES: PTS system mannose/fructose/sorbose family transporter subunit IID [Helcococcus]|uniref:PTS system mannose/fructose/sorbose family transporter subunit IID n=1 Tax=Helcococcus bovis TaxID=3153252 RepID=A0ABW9F4H6_9FIRM